MEWTIKPKEIWSQHKGKLIILLLAQLSTLYYFTKDVINDYRQQQEIIQFKVNMRESLKDTAVVNAFLSDRHFVELFFSNPTVNKKIDYLGVELHKKVVENIIHKDSAKVSQRDYIAAGVNMHPDSVLPFQLRVFKFFKKLDEKELELVTSKQLEELREILELQSIQTRRGTRSRNDLPSF